MAAVATLTHNKYFKLAYHVHCHARLYIQGFCLACLFVTLSPGFCPVTLRMCHRAELAQHLISEANRLAPSVKVPFSAGLAQRQI